MTIEITKFCSKDEDRSNLMYPWKDESWVVACDGRIMVCAAPDAVKPYKEPEKLAGKQPNFRKIVVPPPEGSILRPLSVWYTPKVIPTKPCSTCHGRMKPKCLECNGKGKIICPECGGDGTVICDCDYEHPCNACHGADAHDCENCEGKGHHDNCVDCEGTGVQEQPVPIALPTGHFDARYLNLILDLPNALIAIPPKCEPERGMYFEFDGGKGIVMPIKIDSNADVFALHEQAMRR